MHYEPHRQRCSSKKGMSIVEILVALAVVAVTIVTALQLYFMLSLRTSEYPVLSLLQNEALAVFTVEAGKSFDDAESYSAVNKSVLTEVNVTQVTNFIKEVAIKVSSLTHERKKVELGFELYDYVRSPGGESCEASVFDQWENVSVYGGVDIGEGNRATDIKVLNSFVYLSANSATGSKEDLYIIDARNPQAPVILSKLNTGPGIEALVVASGYVFAANTSSNSQLQVIDISDKEHPHLAAELKVPHADASTTPGLSRSIYFSEDTIYLGTTKNTGSEFHIIDVENPLAPDYKSGFETDTLVHGIFVHKNRAYIATPNFEQMRIMDVSDAVNPLQLSGISLSGWQTQEGKSIYGFMDHIYLGRSVGGFNNSNNHEIIHFNTAEAAPYVSQMDSIDIGASVNGMVARQPFMYLATSHSEKELQVWDGEYGEMVFSADMPSALLAIQCDGNTLYGALDSNDALRIFTSDE